MSAEEQDDRLRRRWREIKKLVPTGWPAHLSLELFGELSRGHLLITRSPEGLWVNKVPGASREVLARSFSPLGDLEVVREHAPVLIGPGGEVQVRDGAGLLYLQLFFFLGTVSYEELLPRVAEVADVNMGRTRGVGAAPKRRVWQLRPLERAALNTAMCRYTDVEQALNAHLKHTLGAWRTRPALEKLVHYLSVDRSDRNCARLYLHEPNQALLEELAEQLKGLDGLRVRVSRLPKEIQEALTPLLGHSAR